MEAAFVEEALLTKDFYHMECLSAVAPSRELGEGFQPEKYHRRWAVKAISGRVEKITSVIDKTSTNNLVSSHLLNEDTCFCTMLPRSRMTLPGNSSLTSPLAFCSIDLSASVRARREATKPSERAASSGERKNRGVREQRHSTT